MGKGKGKVSEEVEATNSVVDNEIKSTEEIKEEKVVVEKKQPVKEEEKPALSIESIVLDLQRQIEALKGEKREPIETDKYDTLDDYLDVPAVFFCFSSEYACHADKRKGKESRPPLGDFIKFKKLYRYNRKSAAGRGVEVVAVSQASVRSRITAEWLREHSLFGFKFFENLNDAKSVDVTLAEKMSECASRVGAMSDMQVIERSKSEGVYVHQDLDRLRKELVQKMAKKDLDKSKSRMEAEFKAERDDENRKVEYSDGNAKIVNSAY